MAGNGSFPRRVPAIHRHSPPIAGEIPTQRSVRYRRGTSNQFFGSSACNVIASETEVK